MKKITVIAVVALVASLAAGFILGYVLTGSSSGEAERHEAPVDVRISVPGVVGDSLEQAAGELRQSGLVYETLYDSGSKAQAGTVIAQSPEAGYPVISGQAVLLTVSNRPAVVRKVVCLDPGHADTPYNIDASTGLNTSDWSNNPEVEIVYDIAVRSKALLEAQGIEVVMTKQSVNDPVNLMQRALIANDAKAALILHIHTDPGISNPTTFYPGGDADHNWKANSDSGRRAFIDPVVQAGSQQLAGVFHATMSAYLSGAAGVASGGVQMENRGATGTGNYGPIFSYDIWSKVPTFTIENNEPFANAHRQEVAQAIANGIIACLEAR